MEGREGEQPCTCPSRKHCFLPASPQEHGLSRWLLCFNPCILPVQTHLLSRGCLTPLSCCSKPRSLQTCSPLPHLGISSQPANLGVPRVARYFACFQPRSCQTSMIIPSTTAWPEAAALSSVGSSLHFPEPQVSLCPTTASIPHH